VRRISPSGRHQARLLGRGLLAPGWAGLLSSRLGRQLARPGRAFRDAPGWASSPRALLRFPAGPPGRLPRLGCQAGCPGWAPWPLAPGPPFLPRLGCFLCPVGRDSFYLAPAGPGQEDPAWPGFPPSPFINSGWATLVTVPAGPGWDPWPRPDYPLCRSRYTLQGWIITLQGRYLPPPAYFLVQHQLQCIVPVLGRLQARTGLSSTVVCWSWDAPWLRPAYPSSPSQSYPQEENKTDDMVILKTDARRRRPRTPSTATMGQAHDHDTSHSTKYGTRMMQATV
jgi:hypothetical protein